MRLTRESSKVLFSNLLVLFHQSKIKIESRFVNSSKPLPQENKTGKPYYPPPKRSTSNQSNLSRHSEKIYGQQSIQKNRSRPEFGAANDEDKPPSYQPPHRASRSNSQEFGERDRGQISHREKQQSLVKEKRRSKDDHSRRKEPEDQGESAPINETGRAEFTTMQQLKEYHTISVPTYQGLS